MQFRSSLVVVAFGLLLATPSIAQKVNATPLKWNPYRDMGGSCVYGAKGEVIHAPEGTVCPDKQKKPATNTGTPDSPLVSLPPALRTEAEALLTDHNHIATELERLRRAIATEGKLLNVKGGVPVVVDGLAIGGIGVGSGTGDQDLEVAKAGLAALPGAKTDF